MITSAMYEMNNLLKYGHKWLLQNRFDMTEIADFWHNI